MAGKFDTGLVYSADRAKPRTMSQSDIAETCTVAGWVHDNAEPVCIVMAESSGQTAVESSNPAGGRNIGLFQVWEGNVAHPEYLKDPVYNANVAYRMWNADGRTFTKHWATAGKCAGRSGNAPLSNEATPTNDIGLDAGSVASSIGNAVAGAIAAVMNSIPWFRVGKGVLGFVLVTVGVITIVVVVANKAPTPVKAVKRAVK
jgi:hypothetical protein